MMKPDTIRWIAVALAVGLAACTEADQEQAREQMGEAGQVIEDGAGQLEADVEESGSELEAGMGAGLDELQTRFEALDMRIEEFETMELEPDARARVEELRAETDELGRRIEALAADRPRAGDRAVTAISDELARLETEVDRFATEFKSDEETGAYDAAGR